MRRGKYLGRESQILDHLLVVKPIRKVANDGMAFLKEGEKYSILLIDDHEGLRQELRTLLSKQEDVDVIGSVGDGAQALKFLSSCEPHVVVLDLNMPTMNGIELAGLIKTSWPEIAIIGLCVMHDSMTIDAFLRAGATAVISKCDKLEELYSAIKRACPRKGSAP